LFVADIQIEPGQGNPGQAPDPNIPDAGRTRLNRLLLALVIFLGVLIVAAVLAVVYGALAGWRKQDASDLAVTSVPQTASQQKDGFRLESLQYTLPKGSTVTDLKVDHGRILVRVKTPTGEEIDTFDMASGRLIARIVVPAR
jgi:hypothetical protein